MDEIQQPNQQYQFYLNTPWNEFDNYFNIKLFVKEIQSKAE